MDIEVPWLRSTEPVSFNEFVDFREGLGQLLNVCEPAHECFPEWSTKLIKLKNPESLLGRVHVLSFPTLMRPERKALRMRSEVRCELSDDVCLVHHGSILAFKDRHESTVEFKMPSCLVVQVHHYLLERDRLCPEGQEGTLSKWSEWMAIDP